MRKSFLQFSLLSIGGFFLVSLFFSSVFAQSPTFDLVITSFSLPSGSPGQTVSASVTVKNKGTATTTAFEVAINKQSSSMNCSSVEDGVYTISALGPGKSLTVSIPVVLPLTAGTYTAIAMADSDCVILESIESNNTKTRSYKIETGTIKVKRINLNGSLFSTSTIAIIDGVSSTANSYIQTNKSTTVFHTTSVNTLSDYSISAGACIVSGNTDGDCIPAFYLLGNSYTIATSTIPIGGTLVVAYRYASNDLAPPSPLNFSASLICIPPNYGVHLSWDTVSDREYVIGDCRTATTTSCVPASAPWAFTDGWFFIDTTLQNYLPFIPTSTSTVVKGYVIASYSTSTNLFSAPSVIKLISIPPHPCTSTTTASFYQDNIVFSPVGKKTSLFANVIVLLSKLSKSILFFLD